jgi:hypothetical protein
MVSVTLRRSPTVPLKTPLHGHSSLRMSRVIGLDSLDYVIIDDDPSIALAAPSAASIGLHSLSNSCYPASFVSYPAMYPDSS